MSCGEVVNQLECVYCEGACCIPERLEFRMAEGETGRETLDRIGLPDATPLEVRIDEHGRRVVRTDCPRRGRCDADTRPEPCLSFPGHYCGSDHSDAERAEIREFCALYRRMEME